jgi:hypothetical protein
MALYDHFLPGLIKLLSPYWKYVKSIENDYKE